MYKRKGFTPLETPAKSKTGISGALSLTGPVRKDVRKNFSNGAGFTLVELLVVIAIIALLMSMLMPALARVKKQAKAAACMSNLNQWGKIFAMYTGDHDGYFMGGWTTEPSEAWLHALRWYYGEQGGITCCPMANKPARPPGGSGSDRGGTFEASGVFGEAKWFGEGDYTSYGINSTVYNIPGEDICYWRRADVKDAAIIPVFLDALWIDGWAWHTNTPPEYQGAKFGSGARGGGIGSFCINRHDGFVNVLFMNWTVRKIGLKQLWTLKWNRRFDTNGPWTPAGGVTRSDWANHGTGWMEKLKDFYDAYE